MNALEEYDRNLKPLRTIIGVAMTVYNEWGSGLIESAYEAGMKYLLEEQGHRVERQKDLPIYWKDVKLKDHYRIDLVVDDIIVELKACKFVSNDHRKQLHNYMRLTKTRFGVLINFSDSLVYSEAFQLYADGTLEKISLKLSPTTQD